MTDVIENFPGEMPEDDNEPNKVSPEDIDNPLDLLKSSYHDFALEELKECEGEMRKRSIVRSIPDDVDKGSINNDLIEYENSTYEFKTAGKGDKKFFVISRALNAIIEKVIKLKSYANNKTDKHGKASIEIQARTDKGTLTSPFSLEGKAKCKFMDFAETLSRASNYLIADGDDGTVKLFRELLNERCTNTVTLLSNPGSIEFENLAGRIYKNCYTDGYNTSWADENDVIKLPNGKNVMLDKSIGSNLPELYQDNIDVSVITSTLLGSMDKAFSGAIGPFLALGLGVMGVFTEKLWKNTCGFPTGFLYGKSKQGKGTIQNLINYIYGFDKTFLAMGNSTYRSVNRKCNAYNSCVIHLNDMTSNAIRTEGFENNIVQSYENIVREKMQDGNKFNNLPQCSAIFVSSNYLPVQKEKMLNRILPIYFEPNMYNPKEMEEYYNEPHYLSKILPELLKYNFNDVLKMIDENGAYLATQLEVEESRESHNVAVAYAGLRLLEQLGNYTIADRDKKVMEYFEWYLEQFQQIEDPVDSFINHLNHLIDERVLLAEEHLWVEKKDGKIMLTISTSACLHKFNCYIGKVYYEKFVQPKEFAEAVKNSAYFVEKKNVRYKIPKHLKCSPIANSYVLDISDSPNSEIIFWAYKRQLEARRNSEKGED